MNSYRVNHKHTLKYTFNVHYNKVIPETNKQTHTHIHIQISNGNVIIGYLST